MNMRDFKVSVPTTLAFVVQGMCWGSFAALIPVLKSAIKASDSQFGMALLLATIGAVAAMWTAPIFERLLGRPVVAVLAAGLGVSFLLPGLAGGLGFFIFAMFLASVASGALDVLMNARVSTMEAALKRSLMSYHHGMFSLAYAVSAFLTGLARAAGLSPFQIFLGVCVVALVFAVFVLKPTPTASASASSAPSNTHLGFGVFISGAIMLIAFMAEQSTEGWSALHLETHAWGRGRGGALGPTLLGGTMALGRFSGQILARFYAPLGISAIAAVVSASGAFIAALASSVSMAYVGFVILGLGVSVIVPMCFAIVGAMVSEDARTQAIARTAAFGYAGFFIGPPAMGFLSEWFGLSASFAFIGASLLLVPVLGLFLARRMK